MAVDKKATKVNDGEVVPVKEGDVITYEIKVTNTGNTTLENVKVNESLQVEGNLNIGTLAPGESKTITVTYKVQKEDVNDKRELVNVVTATDGTTTSEKDEENTPVEPKVPEIDFTVVPTSTETSTVTIPQDVILVLDFSSSMTYEIDDTDVIKIDALKDAVDNFLDSFLKTEGNRVKIIEYDADIMKETEFSSDKSALNISKDKTGSGTNIDYGLTIANQYVTEDNAATTSVILMSDGSPYNYYNDDKHKVDSDSEKNTSEAIESAGWIKSKGAKLYTIGFDIRGDRDAISLMKAIATSEDTYYQTDDGNGLSGAFEEISETITTTHDGTYIPLKTVNGGKGIITKGFKEGQKVEIYTGTYGPNAVPVYTYTWDQFLNLDEVDYTNNVITFDLRTFMSNHQISEDTNVTIRFVDNAIASSRALTQFINIVVEESEEEINKIIQEIDEIEKTNTDTENIKENEKVQTDTMNKTEDNNNKVEEANTDVTNSDIKKPSTDNATKPIESEQAQGEETEPEEKQPIQDNNMLQTNQNKIAEPVKNQEKQNNEIIKIPNIDTSNVKE